MSLIFFTIFLTLIIFTILIPMLGISLPVIIPLYAYLDYRRIVKKYPEIKKSVKIVNTLFATSLLILLATLYIMSYVNYVLGFILFIIFLLVFTILYRKYNVKQHVMLIRSYEESEVKREIAKTIIEGKRFIEELEKELK